MHALRRTVQTASRSRVCICTIPPFPYRKDTGFVQLAVQIGAVSPVSLSPTEITNQASSRVCTQPAQHASEVHAAAGPVFWATRSAPRSNPEMPGLRGPAKTHVTVSARVGPETKVPGLGPAAPWIAPLGSLPRHGPLLLLAPHTLVSDLLAAKDDVKVCDRMAATLGVAATATEPVAVAVSVRKVDSVKLGT